MKLNQFQLRQLALYRRLLLAEFLPFLMLSVFFFTFILVLGDIFSQLWRFLSNDVSFNNSIVVSLLYIPKAIVYAIPIGSMFSSAYSIGNSGSKNELIAVFTSGVSLARFVRPILFIAVLLSIIGYIVEDRFSIPMMKKRIMLTEELLGQTETGDRFKPAAISQGGRVIYYADFFNNEDQSLRNVTVIILDENNKFLTRIDAARGIWIPDEGTWKLQTCRIFQQDKEGRISQTRQAEYSAPEITEPPSTFKLDTRKIDEMRSREARLWIQTQKRAGQPYKALQASYYQRFTLALTPMLVILFGSAIGGRFRRNILLMSLLASLGLSSLWYIFRMIFTLLSEMGILAPFTGAALPFLVFLGFGFWLFGYSRT